MHQAQTKTPAGTITEDYLYGYDRNSNRTSETMTGTDVSGATTFTYGAANIIQSTSGGLTFTHDANGNLTGANTGTAAFAYNTRNQAVSYTPFGGGPLAQNFLGEGQAERISEGATRLQYSQLLGLGTRADAAGRTSFTRDPDGRLIGERRPDGNYYYLFDGLGSITGLTNSTGALVRSYSYEPYGRERQNTGTGPQAAFRFAGGYLMPGAIYHFGQRYMSPVTGRWTQQDPLDRPSDLREGNRYLYAGDDPINLVDPSGEVSCSTFGIGHVCKAVSSALSHRTVRCLLFGLGAAGIGVEGALAARELRASVRAGSTLFDALTKLVRGAGPNIGTTGSISVIVSEVAGGCP